VDALLRDLNSIGHHPRAGYLELILKKDVVSQKADYGCFNWLGEPSMTTVQSRLPAEKRGFKLSAGI